MMKNLKSCLVALTAIVALSWASCTGGSNATKGNTPATDGANVVGLKIAYVNVDSLEAHYELLKKRRSDFKSRQETMERELQQSYQQIQSKSEFFQQKAQTMTQSELQQAEKQLMLMQQSLEGRRQSLTEQLAKEQEEFNKDLKKRLDAFLVSYNAKKGYDYIFSYSAAGGSAIMFASKKFDITNDIIDGMNTLNSASTDNKK
jgi:outer membrane protein